MWVDHLRRRTSGMGTLRALVDNKGNIENSRRAVVPWTFIPKRSSPSIENENQIRAILLTPGLFRASPCRSRSFRTTLLLLLLLHSRQHTAAAACLTHTDLDVVSINSTYYFSRVWSSPVHRVAGTYSIHSPRRVYSTAEKIVHTDNGRLGILRCVQRPPFRVATLLIILW